MGDGDVPIAPVCRCQRRFSCSWLCLVCRSVVEVLLPSRLKIKIIKGKTHAHVLCFTPYYFSREITPPPPPPHLHPGGHVAHGSLLKAQPRPTPLTKRNPSLSLSCRCAILIFRKSFPAPSVFTTCLCWWRGQRRRVSPWNPSPPTWPRSSTAQSRMVSLRFAPHTQIVLGSPLLPATGSVYVFARAP